MALMGQILTGVRLVFGVFFTRKEEFSRNFFCPSGKLIGITGKNRNFWAALYQIGGGGGG